MKEMLVAKSSGVISIEGTGFNEEYIKGNFKEEVEVEDGFKLAGTLEDGRQVEAFLTVDQYFKGQHFRLK